MTWKIKQKINLTFSPEPVTSQNLLTKSRENYQPGPSCSKYEERYPPDKSLSRVKRSLFCQHLSPRLRFIPLIAITNLWTTGPWRKPQSITCLHCRHARSAESFMLLLPFAQNNYCRPTMLDKLFLFICLAEVKISDVTKIVSSENIVTGNKFRSKPH